MAPAELVQRDIPATLAVSPPTIPGKCNAMRRSRDGRGQRCRLSAGHGTGPPGVGPCKKHGGRLIDANLTHGMSSRYLHEQLAPLIAQYQQDPDPLNIYPELAALRALLQRYLLVHPELSDAAAETPTTSAALVAYLRAVPALAAEHPDLCMIAALGDAPSVGADTIEGCGKIIDRITKTVAQIEKIRADNAISRADLVRLLRYQLQVVEQVIAQRLPVSVEIQGRLVDEVKKRWGKFQYGLSAPRSA